MQVNHQQVEVDNQQWVGIKNPTKKLELMVITEDRA